MNNFYTDVIKADPRFTSTSRISDPLLLEPITRSMVQNVLTGAAALGIEVMIFETYRSQQRQEALYAQGASKLRTVGVHHYGLACDIVRVVAGEPSWKGDYSFLGPMARANGLVWGGDWGSPGVYHGFVDSDHVQRCTVAQQAALFSGEWYPNV